MLDVKTLIESAIECLGWPYASPGSNDRKGIDCSGLLVKCYRDQGATISHGSNTIYRKHCGEKGKITGSSQLGSGMVVFKWKKQDTDKYRDGLGDFAHIGLVVSNYPLQIIHASSEAGVVTIDKSIGKWTYWGKLKNVDYQKGKKEMIQSEPELLNEPDDMETAQSTGNEYFIVTAENGGTVNVRESQDIDSKRIAKLRLGTRVRVIADLGEWKQIAAGDKTGYMMSRFLIPEDLDSNDPGEYVCVTIDGLTELDADKLLAMYPQAVKTYG